MTQLANTGNPDRVSLYVDIVFVPLLSVHGTRSTIAQSTNYFPRKYRMMGPMGPVSRTRGRVDYEYETMVKR